MSGIPPTVIPITPTVPPISTAPTQPSLPPGSLIPITPTVPPITPILPVVCSAGTTRYVTRQGQTLADVAGLFNTTSAILQRLNPNVPVGSLPANLALCAPIPPDCPSGQLYRATSTDTLAAIAARFGVNTVQLRDLNPLVRQLGLIPGQLLCIPAPPVAICQQGGSPVLVGRGQTAGDIAVRYNVSYGSLRDANPILDLTRLVEGQRICIPNAGARGVRQGCSRTYVVGPNESLTSVARIQRRTIDDLMRLNPSLLASDFFQGQVICL